MRSVGRQASAILGGHGPDSDAALACEEYGFHLGLGQKLIIIIMIIIIIIIII